MQYAGELDYNNKRVASDIPKRINTYLRNSLYYLDPRPKELYYIKDYLTRIDNYHRYERSLRKQGLPAHPDPYRESRRSGKRVTFSKNPSNKESARDQKSKDKKESRCFHCYEKGHTVGKCPKREAKYNSRMYEVNNVEASERMNDALVESSSSSSSGSENE